MLIYSILGIQYSERCWKVSQQKAVRKTVERQTTEQQKDNTTNTGPTWDLTTHKCRSNMTQDGSKKPKMITNAPQKNRVNFQKKKRIF